MENGGEPIGVFEPEGSGQHDFIAPHPIFGESFEGVEAMDGLVGIQGSDKIDRFSGADSHLQIDSIDLYTI